MSQTTTPPAPELESTAPAAAPAPAAGESTTPAPAAEEKKPEAPKKPSIIATAKSLMSSKGELQTKLSEMTARAEKAEGLLSVAEKTIETQAAELTQLRELETVLNGKVDTLETEQKTVAEKATDLVASTGIPAAELPAQAQAETDTLESLREQIANTSDPLERGRLAAKCRELRNS